MYFVGNIAMSDISRIDGKLLRAFDVLFEERSVSRAAVRLNMTQQGMSGVLQRLRDLFLDTLFVRASHGVVPTPRALELAPLVKAAIESLNAVITARPFDPAQASGTINIATSDYALSAFISPFFRRFKELAPNVRLVVLPRNADNLGKNIRNGRIDLALSLPRFLPTTLHRQKLFDEKYLCAIRADHPLAGTTFDLDTFCACEHLLISSAGDEYMTTTDIALARLNRSRSIGLTIPNYGVATDIIRQTDLIGVLPQSILRSGRRNLLIFPPPMEVEGFEFVMAWPERVHAAPIHVWFRNLCAKLARPNSET